MICRDYADDDDDLAAGSHGDSCGIDIRHAPAVRASRRPVTCRLVVCVHRRGAPRHPSLPGLSAGRVANVGRFGLADRRRLLAPDQSSQKAPDRVAIQRPDRCAPLSGVYESTQHSIAAVSRWGGAARKHGGVMPSGGV